MYSFSIPKGDDNMTKYKVHYSVYKEIFGSKLYDDSIIVEAKSLEEAKGSYHFLEITIQKHIPTAAVFIEAVYQQ